MDRVDAVHAYDRATVDAYLAAVALEQERLRSEIRDARSQIERARGVVGSRQVMTTMLLETCDEVGMIRAAAERVVAQIATAVDEPLLPAAVDPEDTSPGSAGTVPDGEPDAPAIRWIAVAS